MKKLTSTIKKWFLLSVKYYSISTPLLITLFLTFSCQKRTGVVSQELQGSKEPDINLYLSRHPIPSCSETRILNGTNATIENHPYIVKLLVNKYNSDYFNHFCGGVIIGAKVVLTAAHCVEGLDFRQITVKGESEFLHQVNPTTDPSQSPRPTSKVTRVEIHPLRDKKRFTYDLAILFLEHSFPQSKTIPMLPEQLEGELIDGVNLKALGWGNTLSGPGPSRCNRLQMVDLPYLDFTHCQDAVFKSELKLSGHVPHPSHLCTEKDHHQKGICFGDSGGPLVQKIEGRNYLVGLTSFTKKNCNSTRFPDVFVNIPALRPWVDSQLN